MDARGIDLDTVSTFYLCQSAAVDYQLSMQVQKVTAEELEVAIQTRDRPLVIDFYATWCGPCLLLAKELEQVRLFFRHHSHGCQPDITVCQCMPYVPILRCVRLLQVYDELGDDIRIIKIDTDENPDLSSQLQVRDTTDM